jgi:hypothetical protein
LTALSILPPFSIFGDASGRPLDNGSIYIGFAGTSPLIQSNQIAVFSDAALTIPIAQPIRTNGGYPAVSGAATALYVSAVDYSCAILDSSGSLVFSSFTNKTKFGVVDLSSDVTGLLPSTSIKYDVTPAEISAGVTPSDYQYLSRPWLDVKREGCALDGATDDYAAFARCLSVAASTNTALVVDGPMLLGTNTTIPKNVQLWFVGNGKIKPAANKTITVNGAVRAGLLQIFDVSNSGALINGSFGGSEFYPEWWGAVGDGTTDDTPAFTAFFAATFSSTRGGKAVVSGRTYKAQLVINGYLNNSQGEYGLVIEWRSPTIKGRASDNSVILVNNARSNVDTPLGSLVPNYANGMQWVGALTIDMTGMPNAATTWGVAIERCYNSEFCSVHVLNEPGLGGGLYVGNYCYTQTWNNFNCTRVKLHGVNNVNNQSSSTTFNQLTAGQIIIDNFFTVVLMKPVIQGVIDKVVLSDCAGITLIGGDLEGVVTGDGTGAGTYVYRIGSGVKNVVSLYNSPGGCSHASYKYGVAQGSLFLDRPPLGTGGGIQGGIGNYVKTESGGVTVITTTGATTIYDIKDIDPLQAQGLFLVCGQTGTDGFRDLIDLAHNSIGVISARGTFGSPPTRTYSYDFTNGLIKVALSAVAANVIRVTGVENLAY